MHVFHQYETLIQPVSSFRYQGTAEFLGFVVRLRAEAEAAETVHPKITNFD